MTKMAFLPQLKLYLKGIGIIYTVRKYKMEEAMVEVEDVGICKRIPMGVIDSKGDLEPYVDDSGFSNVDKWWDKINYFIPDGEMKYLYKVELVEKNG